LDEFVKARQTAVNEKAEAVDKLKKAFAKEAAATKKAKEEELNTASVELQQLVVSSEAEIKKKAAELRNSLVKEIREVVDTMGRDEKFILILTTENAPYFQQTMDVTDKVIRKYDESKG
jgi:outer membrane protein